MWNTFNLVFVVLLATNCSVASTTKRSASDTCSLLKAAFPSDTILPQDARYKNLTTANWSPTTWETPSCILTPQNTSMVQEVIKTATKSRIKFAIRGGGHSIVPGAASINDGILIDMSGMNSIQYNELKETVTIGSGLRWRDVHSALNSHNRTVVGSRDLDVGVAGLSLGGGLSYFTEKYGMVCDNILNFEVVLANGQVVDANAGRNSDLFWALKGGGNNFGVVTHFTLRTFPIPMVWGGYRVYAPEQLPELISAYAKYQGRLPHDPDANLMLRAPLTNLTTYGVLLYMVYLRPVEEPPAFADFRNIPSLAGDTKVQTYEQFLGEAPSSEIPRWDFLTTTFGVREDMYQKILNTTLDSPEYSLLAGLPGGTLVWNLQPISDKVAQYGDTNGGNALGVKLVSQTWLSLQTGWIRSEDDHKAHNLTTRILNRVDAVIMNHNWYVDYRFMNDAAWDQDVIRSYGKENVGRLIKIRNKYDPTHVFQRLVPGGFKIPRT